MSQHNGFTDEQKNFLQGFAVGADVARAVRGLPVLSGSGAVPNTSVQLGLTPAVVEPRTAAPDSIHREAQDRALAEGKTLTKEELAKGRKDPLAMWDEIQMNASQGVFPKDTDVFLYKFSGLFYVAPAQDAFMCRLRLPGGVLPAWQFRGVADLADRFGAGYADVTTRANLQIREIGAADAPHVLMALTELGIINRGAGADNVRNITASPTSGIDPQELGETLPLARQLHHDILHRRELYGLPRKFNIAFEGGGRVATLEDTNDIGFRAIRVREDNTDSGADIPAGVYFHLTLGGITGHGDFSRPTGILLQPEECVPVARSILRVFIRHGDRTDRKKARLKYLLDAWGIDRFLAEVDREHGAPLRRGPLDRCEPPPAEDRWAHVGFHAQKQPGRYYVGVVLPVGRMTTAQMRGLAALAEQFGSGTIRLTVWQNLLISDIAEAAIGAVQAEIELLGLDWKASSLRSGLVACTGSAGCRFSAADTKRHTLVLADYLEERIEIDQPINIHLTGCPHSCAQHHIGDIGLEATKVEVGEELVEGYHLCVGGGWGVERTIGHRLLDSVPFEAIPATVERLLRHYLDQRAASGESFATFARRQSPEALREIARGVPAAVPD
jgi:ferredoxin-nitrite reductase